MEELTQDAKQSIRRRYVRDLIEQQKATDPQIEKLAEDLFYFSCFVNDKNKAEFDSELLQVVVNRIVHRVLPDAVISIKLNAD